jgi:hypothetical protein
MAATLWGMAQELQPLPCSHLLQFVRHGTQTRMITRPGGRAKLMGLTTVADIVRSLDPPGALAGAGP